MKDFGYTANGTRCSRLVFGAWAIGGAFTGKVDDKESLNTLAFAFDNGLSFFDTAPVYGNGHSEWLLGQFAQNRRTQVFIATKGGISWKTHSSGQRVMEPDGSSINLKRELQASLRRLKTDYIDLYQLHWPDPKTDIAETFETLTQFQTEGLIRFIGVSNFGLSQLKQAKKYAEIIALQNQYNLLSREVETDLLPFIEQQAMYFLAYGSLAYGILTGKFYPSYPFAENDWRKTGISPTNNYFNPSNFEHHLKQVNQLKVFAKELHCSPAQLAIAWLLRHPCIYPLVGAKTIEQTKDNIQALQVNVTSEIETELDQVFT
jgi:aryl-alcohol dehydrogenase-like predicted oxidoreductase